MAETDDHTVAIMVARTPIPTLVNVLRTYLNRTERHVRTHEHMAMLTRSDVGIDKLGIIGISYRSGLLRCRSTGSHPCCQADCQTWQQDLLLDIHAYFFPFFLFGFALIGCNLLMPSSFTEKE